MSIAGSSAITDSQFEELISKLTGLTEINISGCSLTNKSATLLGTLFPDLESYVARDCRNMTANSIVTIAGKCCGLTRLETDCSLDDDDLTHVIHSCPRLMHCIIPGCDTLSNTALKKLVNCPDLKSLKVTQDISDKGLIEIASKCTKLQKVVVDDCPISDEFVKVLARSCRGMQSLSVSQETNGGSAFHLTSLSLFEIAKYSHQLTNLNVCACHVISDISIMRLAKGCPKLIKLNLTNCPKITDAAINEIFEHCKFIQSIGVGGTAVTDSCLLKSAPPDGLRCLIYGSSDDSNGWTIKRYSDNGRHCIAPGVSFFSKSIKFTLGTLETLAYLSPHLVTLVLHGVDGLTDSVLCTIIDCCPLLETIDFSGNDFVTPQVITHITEKCVHLKFLHCPQMFELKDDHVIALITTRPKITSLNLSGCEALTDRSALRVADCCANLQYINFAECDYITDFGALALIRQCPKLVNMSFERCAAVSELILDEICILDHCCHTLWVSECNMSHQDVSEFINIHPMKLFSCGSIYVRGD